MKFRWHMYAYCHEFILGITEGYFSSHGVSGFSSFRHLDQDLKKYICLDIYVYLYDHLKQFSQLLCLGPHRLELETYTKPN